MRAASLTLFLSLVQGAVLSLSGNGRLLAPPYELDLVDPLTGQFTKIAELDWTPSCGVARTGNTYVYGTVCNNSLSKDLSCLIILDSTTGKTIEQHYYPYEYASFGNLEFDKATKQTFVTARNKTDNLHYLFELLPDHTLQRVAALPASGTSLYSGVSSAYKASDQSLFLGVDGGEAGPPSSLLIVNIRRKSVTAVPHAFKINDLMYDDAAGLLYAWGSDESFTRLFMSLDSTTGRVLKTFFQTTELFPGKGCVANTETSLIYTNMINLLNYSSVIHTLNLNNGDSTQVSANPDRYSISMSCQ